MRSMPVIAALALVLTLAIALLAGLFPAQAIYAADDQPGQALVQAKCIKCHTLDRVAAKVGAKDKAWWLGTVGRMKINGASVNAEQIEQIAEYLSGLKKGEKP